MLRRCSLTVLALAGVLGACGADKSSADPTSGPDAATATAPVGAAPDGGGAASGRACDLSGHWITQHHTINLAVSAEQLATNWNYHHIAQDGDGFTITDSLDCGYVVRGTTDVSLGDATLEAMARYATNAVGVSGTFRETERGSCALAFDRIYAIRGADRARFLDAVWQVGDPPVEIERFALPASAEEGMEDWDEDGHEGLTQLTGFGDRYTAQIDWHAFSADDVPARSTQFGGEGVIIADYDAIESVSLETPAALRSSSVPMPPGYGFMARIDGDVEVVTDGDHPELTTCKNVQALAVRTFGDPPRP
jgi:hypothetical protein